ncbi:hypothetical protein ABVT39_019885 [Epinephelus coioides]
MVMDRETQHLRHFSTPDRWRWVSPPHWVNELPCGNNPGGAAAAARSSFPPLPACQLQQSPLSASMPGKHEMATLKAQFGEHTPALPTVRDRARLDMSVCKPGRYLQNTAGENVSGSPGTSLGSVLNSHNPQRVEISERASVARGAMQLLERADLLNVNLLPR